MVCISRRLERYKPDTAEKLTEKAISLSRVEVMTSVYRWRLARMVANKGDKDRAKSLLKDAWAQDKIQILFSVRPQACNAFIRCGGESLMTDLIIAEILPYLGDAMPDVRLEVGRYYRLTGRLELAVAFLRPLASLILLKPVVTGLLGNIFFDLKDFSAAEEKYKEALEQRDGLRHPHFMLTRIALDQRRFSDAEHWLNVAEKKFPGAPRLLHLSQRLNRERR